MMYCIQNKELERTILMLDLDCDELSKRQKEIENDIMGKRVSEPLTISYNPLKENDLLYLLECEVLTKENRDLLGKFYLILFNPSLEKVLEQFGSGSIENRLSKLVKNNNIKTIFKEIM
mgnify:FL=1